MAPTWEHHRSGSHQQPLHLPRQGQLKGKLPLLTPDSIHEGEGGRGRVGERERWSSNLHPPPTPPLPMSCCCCLEFHCSAEEVQSFLEGGNIQRLKRVQYEFGEAGNGYSLGTATRKGFLEIKSELSFFNLTSNLIYLATLDTYRSDSCAFMQQEDCCMSNVM